MDPNLFFAVLRARFGVFALALAATVVAATALSLWLPKSYRATASLVVDTRDEQSLSNALNALLPPRERIAYIQTQVDVITSHKVARKVVDDLKLPDDPAALAAFEEKEGNGRSIEDWLAENLLRNLKVETSQSSIIHVSFIADDPGYAASVANTFAKAYIDTMLELSVEPMRHAASWFDEQLKTLRADLEEAQARLTDYQQRQEIVSADERFDVDHARLAELSSQLVRAQEQTLDLQSREEQAHQVLAQGASLDRLPDIQSNPHIQRLRSELLDGEARLRVLATQYGVNHPDYQRQLTENRSRRQKLDAEMKNIVVGTENLKHQGRQREAELEAALASQRAWLLERRENRDELTLLTRNVETAQQIYDTVMQRFVVSQVESRASQTNVAMLSAAVAPGKPHRPKIALNIALSVVVGTMLGIGIVILMEMSDRRVRSVLDLDHTANLPLLGVLSAWTPSDRLLLSGPSSAGRALPGPG